MVGDDTVLKQDARRWRFAKQWSANGESILMAIIIAIIYKLLAMICHSAAKQLNHSEGPGNFLEKSMPQTNRREEHLQEKSSHKRSSLMGGGFPKRTRPHVYEPMSNFEIKTISS